MGLGIGASFSVLINAATHSVPIRQRGSVSSTFNFNRALGMTVGITVFGMIQSHKLTQLTESFAESGAAVPKGAPPLPRRSHGGSSRP